MGSLEVIDRRVHILWNMYFGSRGELIAHAVSDVESRTWIAFAGTRCSRSTQTLRAGIGQLAHPS
jgi:hypothetical protein